MATQPSGRATTFDPMTLTVRMSFTSPFAMNHPLFFCHHSNTNCSISASGLALTSCLIGQSLSFESLQRQLGALHVIEADFLAGIHAEVEFSEIAVEVLLVH